MIPSGPPAHFTSFHSLDSLTHFSPAFPEGRKMKEQGNKMSLKRAFDLEDSNLSLFYTLPVGRFADD
ncbi:hypothetical protein SUGI_1446730 [Cryptomeria japonica]|uniref:Uncharacterized protein n=1 Tax=Cryptomeria japonica TaxID=3369 RepID=A0AAD3RP35_CRYJA|nr:hypothetical protein SUGI_0350760 [Cryptomeria japonica]GLJ58402.1 hypothetical protein SUGI_1446730 [Cryptomeria japonica]